MNETMETILRRRSVRAYTAEPVDEASLEQVLEAGLYAANGGGHQTPRFLTVLNQATLDAISAIVREEFAAMEVVEGQYINKTILKCQRIPGYDFRFHAPVLIVVSAPPDFPNAMADCAGAIQNMQIAACSLGLGACYVNQLHWLDGNDRMRAYLAELGIPRPYTVCGSMVLGHPAGEYPKAVPRREDRIRILL